MPPSGARPDPILVAPGQAPGIDALAGELALAGYERVDQAQERGQFALRGGIVDVYPTTGREPLRIELFETRSRAFAPFPRSRNARSTPSTLRPSTWPSSAGSIWWSRVFQAMRTSRRGSPRISSCRLRTALTSSGSRAKCARSGRKSSSSPCGSIGRSSSTRSPQDSRSHSRRSGRQSPPAASRRPRTSSAHSFAAGCGRQSPFPTRERHFAPRTSCAASKRACSSSARSCPTRPSSCSRSAWLAAASSGASSGSPSFPTHRSSAARARGRAAPPGRALQSFAELRTGDYVVHEDHGVGKLLGFETREIAGITRDYLSSPSAAKTGSTSHTSRSERSRATSAPMQLHRHSQLGAAEPAQDTRPSAIRELAGERSSSTPGGRTRRASRTTSPRTGSSVSKHPSRTRRRPTSARRSRP